MNKHRNYLIENQPAENNELNRNNPIQKYVNEINISKDNITIHKDKKCSDESNNAGGTKRTRNTLRLSKTKYSRNKKTRNKKTVRARRRS